MKLSTLPSSHRFGMTALLAACLVGSPFISQARPGDERRERSPGESGRPMPSRPSAPTPSARPSVSRPSIPARPAPSARPSVPQQRPSQATRPSVTDRPPAVTRPTPSRPPSVVTRPSVQRPDVITRPSVQRPDISRPSAVRPTRPSIVQRPDRDNDRPEIRRPEVRIPEVRRPEIRRPDSRSGLGFDRPGFSTSPSSRHRHFSDSSRFAQIDRSVAFRSYPRHHYRLCHGNGYRGIGWYFGPPNVTYYYETPGVSYYSSREYAPSSYLNLSYSAADSLDYAVQEALADLGYYNGPVDGDIGPMSRLAIANFQADNGLEPTGIIDETLVAYLEID